MHYTTIHHLELPQLRLMQKLGKGKMLPRLSPATAPPSTFQSFLFYREIYIQLTAAHLLSSRPDHVESAYYVWTLGGAN